jgi:Hydrolases of the alpha/beta superfamily
MEVVLYILLGVIGLFILPTMCLSFFIFRALVMRPGKEGWGRQPSMPSDNEYCRLYDDAMEWGRLHADDYIDVEIENDGCRLYGQYFDFGGSSAVIILPGRMEACTYSYHYAWPYSKSGWNVLVIDPRSHGRSDGRFNYLGFREYRDVIAWTKLLKERFNINKVVLHGICIGSSAALFAAVSKDCPDSIAGIIADGMYQCFYDSCRCHMVRDKHPLFPFLFETMLYIRMFCRIDPKNDGPKKRILDMHRPILFIHSKEDPFSVPEKAQEMFDRCPSQAKFIHWFDHGGHSRLRLTDPEAYDKAVIDYITKL